MRKTIPVLGPVLFLLLIPFLSGAVDAEQSDVEYVTIYGDLIELDFGSDTANIAWKVKDSKGLIIKEVTGRHLSLDGSDYDMLYVVQTAETAYGSNEKTLVITLKHLNTDVFRVAFFNGDNEVPVNEVVFDGHTVCRDNIYAEPPTLVPPNGLYVFDSWYTKTSDGTEVFTGSTPVMGNMDVFAKWNVKSLIRYMSNGEEIYSEYLLDGEHFNFPEMYDSEECSFGGWSRDAFSNEIVDTEGTAEGEATFYAQWIYPPEEEKEVFNPLLIVPIGAVVAILLANKVVSKRRRNTRMGRYRN